MLFETRNRFDHELAKDAETEYAYLDRSARPDSERIRVCLEAWFGSYPDRHKAELRSSIRSNNDAQFTAAVYELYLHEVLRRLGCHVEIHPDNPSGKNSRPDFRVFDPSRSVAFIEAVFASDMSDLDRAAEKRKDVVYDCLNEIDSPDFFLGMLMSGDPKTPPPAKMLRKEVAEWLSRLSWNDPSSRASTDGTAQRPRYLFDHDGWHIEFVAHAKSDENRGRAGVRPLGIRVPGLRSSTHADAMRAAILKKAGKYGELRAPLVIAVNVGRWHASHEDVLRALFGDLGCSWSVDQGAAEPVVDRKPNGVWIGQEGPRYRRVSAILFSPHVTAWSVAARPIRLYHNPWAHKPYEGVLERFPQAVPNNGFMDRTEGVHPREVLGLYPGWPEEPA